MDGYLETLMIMMMVVVIWEEEMEQHNKKAEVSLNVGMMETWKLRFL